MTFKFGKFMKRGGHSIGHVFKSVDHKVEGSIHDVYTDYKGAVSFAGKHLIKDVDNVSSALSSPFIWIAVGGVVLVVLMNKK